MLQKILQLIFGSKNERTIKTLLPILEEINSWEEKLQGFSDEELAKQTEKFRRYLQQGKSLEEIIPEAFATVREAAWRSLGLRHYDVQILGALVLHQGKIAEMKTGEGKTLTATAAIYVNALTNQGAHIVTVNDYLARRDANWMKPVYDRLGVSVGVIQNQMDPLERRQAYQADITYGTNSEFGFDYLRDNMVTEVEMRVQRGFHFAIVDEVDSILIDEARTPLIISGPTEENTDLYRDIDRAILHLMDAEKKAPEPEPEPVTPQLGKKEKELHVIRGYYYDIDEKARNVFLTEAGVQKLEEILGIENLFSLENTELVAHSNQALRAHLIFKIEVDYVLQGTDIVLVDEHTGRTMPGRRYGDGLHQAIEAKERVEVKKESQTLASITYQNFFRKYQKLAGMTGTADTEAEEFKKIYNLDVVVVPTNLTVRRADFPDRIYCTEKEKYDAIIQEIKDCMTEGQPVLVGTISIEKSEYLSELLKKHGIIHNVLNAKHHAHEAEIIENAGKPGVVTVATNMAGRGTDIVLGGAIHYLKELEQVEGEEEKLQQFKEFLLKRQFAQAKLLLEQQGASLENSKRQSLQQIYEHSQLWLQEHEKVKAAGGLHILGTERHEARRIDNQLRGRSGRQGDPGSSRFYLSLEDNLMRIFGGEKIKNLMARLGIEQGQELEAKMVDKAIARAQKRVESHNFDIRKHLIEYDEVMNRQREYVYQERNRLLDNKEVRKHLMGWMDETIESQILHHCQDSHSSAWDLDSLEEWLAVNLGMKLTLDLRQLEKSNNPQLQLFEQVQTTCQKNYTKKVSAVGEEAFNYVERRISLDVIDARWKEHLHQMDQLRDGIWASGYAERNPLVEFKLKGFELFDQLASSIKEQVTEYLFRVQIEMPEAGMETQEHSRRPLQTSEHREYHDSINSLQEYGKFNQSNAFLGATKPKEAKLVGATRTTTSGSSGGASRRKTSRRRRHR